MQAQVISFKCILKNRAGQFISSTYNRDVLVVGDLSFGGSLSGLNKNLQNLNKGEKRLISLSAEEAYGLYDPNKVILFPAKKLPRDLKIGASIQITSQSGVTRTYRVLEILSDFVRLDGNHPLAGQDLVFEIDALDARDATQQEIEESLNIVTDQMLH